MGLGREMGFLACIFHVLTPNRRLALRACLEIAMLC